MNSLCLGMDYYQFRASINFEGRISPNDKNPQNCGATVHVLRIDPSGGPFLIGSHTNGSQTITAKSLYPSENPISYPREAVRVESKISTLSRIPVSLDKSIPVNLQNPSRLLQPVWISNGTFFSNHVETVASNYTRVLGPTVHNDKAVVDVRSGSLARSKLERWDSNHNDKANVLGHINGTYRRVNIEKRLKSESVFDLARSNRELLGGAGLLVSDYTPQSGDFGGGFDFSATYSTGPTVARTLGNHPIYYVIYIYGDRGLNISWKESASYLTKQFASDLKIKRIVQDAPIQDACVYDGGGSRQLWVKNQTKTMQFKGAKVPNYLYIWGSLAKR